MQHHPNPSTRRRASAAAGLATALATGATPVGAAPVPPPTPTPMPWTSAAPSASGATGPVVLAGTVAQGGTGAPGPAGTRLDVYTVPEPEQPAVLLVTATSDPDGRFEVRHPPGPLADGAAHDLIVIASSPDGASVTGRVQVRWLAASSSWAAVEAPEASGRRRPATASLDFDLPAASSRDRRVRAAGAPQCRPVVRPGAVIPLEPTTIVYAAALVQPPLKDGRPVPGTEWAVLTSIYNARSLLVGNADNVAIKADFSATFGSVKLGVSGERVLDTGDVTEAVTGLTYQSFRGRVTGILKEKQALLWRTWAQLYECIDNPRSLTAGRVVYSPAYVGIELAEADQEDAVLGQAHLDFAGLAVTSSGKYAAPCGTSRGHQVSPINPHSALRRSSGQTQTFSDGTTTKLGAGIVGVQGSRTRTETSTSVSTEQQWTEWGNLTDATKYLCGYDGLPSNPANSPGYVVAMGTDPT